MLDVKNVKIVVLTGAGISAESGIQTFRGSDGLWEGYRIEEVATPEAWHKNPALVQEFYNIRRKAVLEAAPNVAHTALAELGQMHDVRIITQNIDNLHERAGSRNVLHLHGEITKARSSFDETLVYDIPGWELKMGEVCSRGHQLRPHIVWFGEAVPMIEEAAAIVSEADVLLIVGTSLVVYPAAGLVHYAPSRATIVVVDPEAPHVANKSGIRYIRKTATEGIPYFIEHLLPGIGQYGNHRSKTLEP